MKINQSPVSMHSPEEVALYREDIALRLFCAMLSGHIRHDQTESVMRYSFKVADQFLAVADEERAKMIAATDMQGLSK